MGTAYEWVMPDSIIPKYEDLGLVISAVTSGDDGYGVLSHEYVYTDAIEGYEWARKLSILTKSSKAYSLILSRIDKDGTESINTVGAAIVSNHAATATTWILYETTILPGASFKIGVYNNDAADASDINVRLTILG